MNMYKCTVFVLTFAALTLIYRCVSAFVVQLPPLHPYPRQWALQSEASYDPHDSGFLTALFLWLSLRLSLSLPMLPVRETPMSMEIATSLIADILRHST